MTHLVRRRDEPEEEGNDQNRGGLRVCVICTVGISIQILYAGKLEYLTGHGFEVTAACASSPDDDAIRARGIGLKTFPLTRAITPLQDVRAVVQLWRWLRAEQFDLIEVATPKAALLGAFAARLAGSRCVVHVLHGLAYEGKRGLLGAILRASVYLPCRLADLTFAVSPSVAAQVSADGLARRDRVRVIGSGSCNGVDTVRFSPANLALRPAVRETWRIPAGAVVIGFVGRLVRDKGVEELSEAFEALHRDCPNVVLLVVGDYEHRDRPSAAAAAVLSNHPAVRHVGFQTEVAPFLAAMDVFVLPTHREGLGNVLIEAAATGIPTITTTATGARDASLPGTTGLQVPVGDVVALKQALVRLISDGPLRTRMGRAGRQWVCEQFDQQVVWRRYAEEYRTLALNRVQSPPETREK